MPFFLRNSIQLYCSLFITDFLFLNFCCSWPILIPLCFPAIKPEEESIIGNTQTFLMAPFTFGAPNCKTLITHSLKSLINTVFTCNFCSSISGRVRGDTSANWSEKVSSYFPDRHFPNSITFDHCLSNGYTSKILPNRLLTSKKVRGLVPIQGCYSLDLKAFLQEWEESSEPRVGELPKKMSPSLGYGNAKKTQRISYSFIGQFSKCYMRVSLSSSLAPESSVETRLLPGTVLLGTLGKSLTSLCLNFCTFLTYLTEVV